MLFWGMDRKGIENVKCNQQRLVTPGDSVRRRPSALAVSGEEHCLLVFVALLRSH